MSFKKLEKPKAFVFDNHEDWYVGVLNNEMEYLHNGGLIVEGTSGYEALKYLFRGDDKPKLPFAERMKMYGGYYYTFDAATAASKQYYDDNNEHYPYEGHNVKTSPFAKLFDTDHGQILVKLDAGEEAEPEVRFYVKPDGLGVCSLALKFKDTDEGWDAAELVFDKIDKERAIAAVADVIDMSADITTEW